MMGATTGRREQLIFELGHTPSHDESDFVVGEGNELAHGHVMAFPDWPHGLTLITGPASSGKSHLARIWAVRAGASFAAPGTLEPLSREGGRSPLVIEDVDRVDYEESALFHLVNQAMRDGRPVLMTAREPVANWPFQTDDLKSRARLAAHFAVKKGRLSREDEAEIVRHLLRLRSALEGQQSGEAMNASVTASRAEVINIVNNFFYEKLSAVPEITAYMDSIYPSEQE